MEKIKRWVSAILASKRFNMGLSLVLAFFVWLGVVTFVDSTSTRSIAVPVDTTYNTASYKMLGLDIVNRPSETVYVRVEGDTTVISSLTSKDFVVSPSYTTVTEPGSYQLKLDIKKANAFAQFEIIGPTDQYIEVSFAKIVTKTFAVAIDAQGVQPAEGYYLDTPTALPKEISITGPEPEVLKVDKVLATVQLNEERTEPVIAMASLSFLDKEGSHVESTYLTSSTDQVEVSIPIYKVKEIPLTVGFANVPSGFDVQQLKPELSQSTIRIAGTAEQVDKVESLEAGIVNLSMFKLGEPVAMSLDVPDGLINVDSLQTVLVTFDTSGYVSKTVTVSDVRVINAPAGMEITFPTARINSVVLIGTQKELEELTHSDVIAQVDASTADISVVNGQQNLKVQIVVPSTQTVFATGNYMILCEIKTEE